MELKLNGTLNKGTSKNDNEYYILTIKELEKDVLLGKQDIRILKLLGVIK